MVLSLRQGTRVSHDDGTRRQRAELGGLRRHVSARHRVGGDRCGDAARARGLSDGRHGERSRGPRGDGHSAATRPPAPAAAAARRARRRCRRRPTATPQSYPPEQVRAGQPIFAAQCGFCHGRDAMGGETRPGPRRARRSSPRTCAATRSGRCAHRPRRQGHAGVHSSATRTSPPSSRSFTTRRTKAASLTGGRRGVDVADLQTGNADAGQRVLQRRVRAVPFARPAISPASPTGCRGSRCCSGCCIPTPAGGRAVAREGDRHAAVRRDGRRDACLPRRVHDCAHRFDRVVPILSHAPGEVHRRRSAAGAHRAARKYTDDDMHNVLAYLQTLR